ncbi:MAG: hypothetical protein WCJ37_02925 [Syntrophus sp. (in: bacteria)]
MGKEYIDFENYRLEKLQNRVNRKGKKNTSKRIQDEDREIGTSGKEKPLSVACAFEVLEGEIYCLGNILFNIPKNKSIRHPGAVIELRDFSARVSKGTDEKNIIKTYYRKGYIEIIPDDENGLKKPTLFSINLYEIKVKMFYHEDRVGKLSADDYHKMYSITKNY